MSVQITVPTPQIIHGEQVIRIHELWIRTFVDCEGRITSKTPAGLFLTKTAVINHIKHLQNSFKDEPEWWMHYATDLEGNLVYEVRERFLTLN